MASVGTLIDFAPNTTIVSADLDQNLADLRTAINTAVFTDEINIITAGLRLANDVALSSRNAADDGTLSIVQIDGNDRIVFGTDFGNLPIDGVLDIALGGGASATLGTIGGSGPAAAAQAGWLRFTIDGTPAWFGYWQ